MGCGNLTGQLLQNPRVLRKKKAGFLGNGTVSLLALAFAALVVASAFWAPQSASGQTQACAMVQINPTGDPRSVESAPVALSGDGTHIAFFSTANLVNDENPDRNQELFVSDVTNPNMITTRQITHTSARDSIDHRFSITIDGGKVAFASTMDIDNGNTNHAWQIFVYDATNGITQITHSTDATR